VEYAYANEEIKNTSTAFSIVFGSGSTGQHRF
jgi:hypothetical protein